MVALAAEMGSVMDDRLGGLLPCPRVVRAQPGRMSLRESTPIVASREARAEGRAVRDVLGGLPWPSADDNRDGEETEILVGTDRNLPAEGYQLTISPQRLNIVAADPPGAFYAAQTVKQLLPDDAFRGAPVPGLGWALPCAVIEDSPSMAWRGGHLDVARHFFPKATVFRFIDMLAAHKLNRLHLHLTDDQGWRIESPSHPTLHQVGSWRPETQVGWAHASPTVYDGTPHGGYFTLADLAEIHAYAARRMVRVVPEVEMPGHASALLAALPELAPEPGAPQAVATGWGITPQIVSPLPGTVAVLTEVLGELLGAIPADYVHIGGDECVLDHWRSSPRVEAYRRQLGLPHHDALHAYFLRQVADILADSFGVRAAVWDEGFASTATSAASGVRLREDTLVMAWRSEDIARRAALAGHDVVATPVMPTYLDYFQAEGEAEPLAIGGPVTIEDVAGLTPRPDSWPDAARERLVGTQFQLWTEYIPDSRSLEYMMFPRAAAFADVAWHGRPADWPELRERVRAQLGRLDAAGTGYRPLDGPYPWQQGGTGARRHWSGSRINRVTSDLADLADGGKDLTASR